MRADFGAEDWGHRVDFGSPDLSKLSLCCGHVQDDQWSCFCDPERPVTSELERVVRAVDELFSRTPEITEVEWFENDAKLREFNHAPRPFP